MTAEATSIVETKRFLVALSGALKNPYSPIRPLLVLDNHSSHRSDKIREELGRFRACFQPAFSSEFQCAETLWAHLKREYFVRLHRREENLKDHAEFEAMIQQLYQEVPIDADAILRVNQPHIARYLALGAEQDSSGDE